MSTPSVVLNWPPSFAAVVEVLGLERVGQRDNAGEGRARRRGDPDLVHVEVLLLGHQPEDVLAGRKGDAPLGHPGEGVEVAGWRYGDGAGDVVGVDLDPEGAGRGATRDAQGDLVLSRRLDVDRIFEPFPGLEVVHHEASAGGIERDNDVHTVAGAVLAAGVARDVVVIGDAFAAVVEVFGLERPGQRDRRSAERRLRLRCERQGKAREQPEHQRT